MPEISQSWRIVKSLHATDAFSGEGARLYGGRWNSRGTRMVYTSAHLSLAVLEILVHLRPQAMPDFSVIPVAFPPELAHMLPTDALPLGWRNEPPGTLTRKLGDNWVREASSAILAVPSALIPNEFNLLLNPAHKDFPSISVGTPQPLVLDQRLAPKGSLPQV